MLIFVIAVIAIMIPVLLGILLALGTARLETAVAESKVAIENKDKGYNPSLTIGHKIKVNANVDEQLREARRLAAERAAALPRGANMRIGRLGRENLRTASEGLAQDPLTAVRIAAFHGWDGARAGAPSVSGPVAAPVAAPTAAPAANGEIELVPGKDYPHVEITDTMSPDEVRKARIANAKAKSAAMKAAKAARASAGVAAPAAVPAPATQPTPTPAAVVSTIPEPQYIEITEDMAPEEIRKARVENSKMKSAYNKALKAAGIDPQALASSGEAAFKEPTAGPAATSESPQAATPAEPTPPTTYEPVAVPANIAKPDYIEITDDMSPEAIRQARIHNSKARSQYNKALKAAGIDPQTVS